MTWDVTEFLETTRREFYNFEGTQLGKIYASIKENHADKEIDKSLT